MSNTLSNLAAAPEVEAVLIDLDGTLVDTMGDFAAALNPVLVQLGAPVLPPEAIVQMVGKGSENLVRKALLSHFDAATTEALFDDALAAYQDSYRSINGQFATLYPQVKDGLTALCDMGLPLACVTNKPVEFARQLLAHLDIAEYFTAVYGGDSFAKKKPDPMPFIEAGKALGAQPANTLVLGDSQNDAQAAQAAGMRVWLLPYGYNHGEPIQTVPCDAIVETILAAAHKIQANLSLNAA